MSTRAQRLAARQAKAISRTEARLNKLRAKSLGGQVTISASSLPPAPSTSPISLVMDQPQAPLVADSFPVTAPGSGPTDFWAIPTETTNQLLMAQRLPKITKQQLKYERRQLKKLPGMVKKINKLNQLREQQEFLLNQQMEGSPDYSQIRGAAQYTGGRAGTEGGSAYQNPMFDPMAAGPAPGPGGYAPGSWGPPMNYFSQPSFQPPAANPSGGYMLPPSQSGLPGGLIYSDVPEINQEMDLSNEPIFEDEGEAFGEYMEYAANFANMEPLDSYGAVTGEAGQTGFFDKITGLVSQAGNKYAEVQTAKYNAKYAKPPMPASSQMRTGGSLDQRTVLSLLGVALGGLLILQAIAKK